MIYSLTQNWLFVYSEGTVQHRFWPGSASSISVAVPSNYSALLRSQRIARCNFVCNSKSMPFFVEPLSTILAKEKDVIRRS